MSPEHTVITTFVSTHPRDAARLVGRMSSDRAGHVLEILPGQAAARLVEHLEPMLAARAMSGISTSQGAKVIDGLSLRLAAATLRRIDPELRRALLAASASARHTRLKGLLSHPPGSAGSLMDPEVFALSEDLLVDEALEHLREHAELASHYVYVTDAGILKGALGVAQLLRAAPTQTLASLCGSTLESLPVGTQLNKIADHAAWSRLVALPVLDAERMLLGVLRYSTLRRIEQELRSSAATRAPGATGVALAELYGLAVAGVLEWPSLLFANPGSRS